MQKVNLNTKEILPLLYPNYYIVGIDGLYKYKSSLLGIQNVIFPESINKFILSSDNREVSDIKIISYNEPAFTKVTTGAIKDNFLYFIANSHIDQLDEDGTVKDASKLRNLEVYKVRLD